MTDQTNKKMPAWCGGIRAGVHGTILLDIFQDVEKRDTGPASLFEFSAEEARTFLDAFVTLVEAPIKAPTAKDAWETVIDEIDDRGVRRLAVPGGWLYQVAMSNMSAASEDGWETKHYGWHPPVFVPDPDPTSRLYDLYEGYHPLTKPLGAP